MVLTKCAHVLLLDMMAALFWLAYLLSSDGYASGCYSHYGAMMVLSVLLLLLHSCGGPNLGYDDDDDGDAGALVLGICLHT